MTKRIVFILVGAGLVIGVIIWILVAKNSPSSFLVKPQIEQSNQDTLSSVSSSAVVPPAVVDDFPNDRDRDGLEDKTESELGLSDTDFDSDQDGLSDLNEIERYKTNPKNKDTDGDGYFDGFEVRNGFHPNGPGKLPEVEETRP